jgi:hypothetical protein
MPEDRYEPNRFLGFPVRPGPHAGQDGEPRARTHQGLRTRPDEEPQRMMGFPVGRLGGADQEWLESLAHPIRGCRRWLRRRRLGPFATGDEDQPKAPR